MKIRKQCVSPVDLDDPENTPRVFAVIEASEDRLRVLTPDGVPLYDIDWTGLVLQLTRFHPAELW